MQSIHFLYHKIDHQENEADSTIPSQPSQLPSHLKHEVSFESYLSDSAMFSTNQFLAFPQNQPSSRYFYDRLQSSAQPST